MFKNINLIGIFLSKKEKKISLILVFLLLIGTILEMIGLGSLPIYLFAILDSKKFFTIVSDYKINFIDFLNIDINYSRYDVAFYGAFFLVIFFSLKNLYQFFVAYIQARMIFNISKRNSLDLYKQYIRSEYLYYIDKNPSEIIRNIAIVEDAILFLSHLINISREILLLFFSFFILFFIDVKITLVIFSFFIFSIIIILLITKNKSKKFASKINNFRSSEIKELNQSIEGIKDLKVFQQEEFFEKKFDLITGGIYLNKFYLSITHTIPKLILEIMSISFISILLVFFVNTTYSFELIIFKLTAYAVVIVRMLPSFSVIASNANQLRATIPALQILHGEFSDRKKYLYQSASFNREEVMFNSFNSLVIKNINFFYEKTHPIIKNFSLEVRKGETIGIIGESGKGKSTLVNLILGLIKPADGDIKINNISIIDKKINKDFFGFVQQNVYLLDDTIKRNIAFGVPDEEIDDEKIKKSMITAQIYDFVLNMNYGVETVVGNRGVKLSGGQVQRIGIARAIYRDPKILILDESTSSLDLKTENDFLDTLKKLKKDVTMIIISHKKHTLEFCDKIFRIL